MSPSVSVSIVHNLSQNGSGPTLIDVRSPAEFESVHAVGAVNVPLDRFGADSVIQEHGLKDAGPVYVICKSGGRSAKACQLLEAAGLADAINVEGGTDRWVAEGLPVVRGVSGVISIQRQVQLCAGSIALTGALLSFVHPWWAALPAFIGAGLVFSGLTNTCGMGTMLASMPWNQASKPQTVSHQPAENESVSEDKNAAKDCDTGG